MEGFNKRILRITWGIRKKTDTLYKGNRITTNAPKNNRKE